MARSFVWPAILCACACAGAQAARADPTPAACAALTQWGAYDTRPTIKDKERAEAFRNWLCQGNIASDDALTEASTSLGIPPATLHKQLGFNVKAQDFTTWKNGYCSSYAVDKHVSDATLALLKTVHPTVLATIADCEKLPGVHARVESTASQCHFFLRLADTPAPDGAAAQAVQVTSADPSITCSPQPLNTTISLKQPTDLLCRRHSDNGVVLTVTVPSVGAANVAAVLVLPDLTPQPSDVLSGDFQVEIAWRDRTGRTIAPTSDIWHVELGPAGCRITGSGTPWSPHSAWFNQATASCSEGEIRFTGYRSWDPAVKAPSSFSLTLRSDDNGETFSGGGQDSLGGVAIMATARHRGEQVPPDQLVCGQ